jgi:hypothetical protein
LEEKIVTNGKAVGSGATMIKKRETRGPGGLATERGIAQGGTLSRARTVWTVKRTGTTDCQAAAMDQDVEDSNSRGFEVTSLKMENKNLQGASGDGIAVLLEVTTGTEIGLQRLSKIPSGWTLQKQMTQTKSIRMKTFRSSWSA